MPAPVAAALPTAMAGPAGVRNRVTPAATAIQTTTSGQGGRAAKSLFASEAAVCSGEAAIRAGETAIATGEASIRAGKATAWVGKAASRASKAAALPTEVRRWTAEASGRAAKVGR